MPDRKTNLGTGPWRTLREDRRRRFHLYCQAWDAGRRGEVAHVPGHLTAEEKEEIRRGWTAARRIGGRP